MTNTHTHPSDPRPHRHQWNRSGGRFEEGTKRTCLRCKQQQIKTRGRWMPVEYTDNRAEAVEAYRAQGSESEVVYRPQLEEGA